MRGSVGRESVGKPNEKLSKTGGLPYMAGRGLRADRAGSGDGLGRASARLAMAMTAANVK